MTASDPAPSRRDFVSDLGRAAVLAPLAARLPSGLTNHANPVAPGDWDLSWIQRLDGATDRAVFDWGTMGDPADPIVLEIAARYLDGCAAAYGAGRSRPAIVLNIRSSATAAGLSDDAWNRFELAAEHGPDDPETKAPARRNPFLRRAKNGTEGLPDLADLIGRGAILLVCDFSLGHMAARLGDRLSRPVADVHRELQRERIPGSFVVPSGIFGLARAQNAGCAFVRM
jgi:hypothetical protein